MKKNTGFTLIEVLLALAVIAIALTALIKATSQTITNTARIKDKSISHWVAMQGITAIQLGALPVPNNQKISQVTTMLGERWYWQAVLTNTAIPHVLQITITVSKNPSGPFVDPLIAFKHQS